MTAKKFKNGLKHASFKKKFLSEVRLSGVKFFLRWIADHPGDERDGPPDETYNEQEFDHEKGFDEQFCRVAYRSRECQDAKAVDSVVASVSQVLAKQVVAAIQCN